MAQLQNYHEKMGTTVLMASHSMEEVAKNADRIVVLNGGHNYMEGTPRQVFARTAELEQVGLDVPLVTKIAIELKQRGLPVDDAVYTVEELQAQMLSLRGGGC